MSSPCIVIAIFQPKPQHLEQVRSALKEIMPEVHQEPGCELYALHEGVEGSLVFIEKWANRENWMKHNNFHTVARIKQAVDGLLDKPIDVHELYGVEPGTSYPTAL